MRHPFLVAAALVSVILFTSCRKPERSPDAESSPTEPTAVQPEEPPEPELRTERYELAKGDTMGALFERAKLEPGQAREMIDALRPLVDPRRVRPGQALAITQDDSNRIVQASWETSFVDVVDLRLEEEKWVASQRAVSLETELAAVSVTITSSLWDAFVSAGENPALAVLASDVLAWEVDFYRDIRAGDLFELLVEKVNHNGQFVRYGDLRAVKYDGHAGRHEFFSFHDGETTGWYARDGRSARRAFLKQPLPLVRITSGFGGRRHPILGYVKNHSGVDYGAPTGTPVWAVGDGVVTWAGMKGANGNLISVRHSNGFTSHYAHLSQISKEVKKGARVVQKQVIGRVGSTGRSTGPHLHFALSKDKKFVNPLTQKFPSGTPLPETHREAFDEMLTALAGDWKDISTVASIDAPDPGEQVNPH